MNPMKKINDLVIFASHSGWFFILSFVGAFGSLIFVFGNINAVMESLAGNVVFDMQNTLTVAQVFDQLSAYSDEARHLYYAFSFVDFFFPFFAGLVMAAPAAFAIRHTSPALYGRLNSVSLFALLMVPTLFDWLENILALTVISSFPEQRETAAQMMIFAKKAKLASIVIAQAIVVIALAGSAVRWVYIKRDARR